MKKGFVYLLVFLLTLSLASAANGISVELISGETSAEPGQSVEILYHLTNEGSKIQQLQLGGDAYAGLPSSNLNYIFVEPNYLVLQGHETVEVVVEVKFKKELKTGKRYKTYFNVKSLDDQGIDENYDVEVFLKEPTESVSMMGTGSLTAVPGKTFTLPITLTNNLNEDLSNIDIYVTSDIFDEEKTVQLFSRQERDVEFLIEIPPTASPSEYTYSARVFYENELSSTFTETFSVSLNSEVTTTTVTTDGFLFAKTEVTKTNNGNAFVDESYLYDVPLFQGWFINSNIPAVGRGNGEREYLFQLAPAQDYTITITIDYRPLIIAIIVIILLALILWYLFTTRVSIKKEAFKLKYSTEGLSDFKILLHVKNNTNKPIKDVTVIDRLPKVIQPTTNFGTLHPTGVERGDKGIRMMWKIPKLLKGEERIISYNVHAKMNVIGNLNLPKALGKYKNNSKRTIRVTSNRPQLYSSAMQKAKKKPKKKPVKKEK